MPEPHFLNRRKAFHRALLEKVLTVDSHGVATNADKDSRISRELSYAMIQQIGKNTEQERLAGQRAKSDPELAAALASKAG